MADQFNILDTPSGGASVSDALFIGSLPGGGLTLPDAVAQTIEWDDSDFGGALYVVRGSAISWNGDGDPANITINTTGTYDMQVMCTVTAGTNPAAMQCGFKVNGSIALIPGLFANVGMSGTEPATPADTCSDMVLGYALTAGDVVSVQINQSGNAANDTEMAYAMLQIIRRS